MQNGLENFRLELDNRKKLTMSGVETVDGFTASNLKLTVNKIRVSIVGENIKISSFNKATGLLIADGIFNEIKYLGEKSSFVKRIFK